MKIITLLLFLFVYIGLDAQLIEYEIISNPRIEEEYKVRMSRANNKSLNRSVSLPFVDDFSQDHFIGNEDGNVILWEDLTTYHNNSYPINPPSVGVTTFDGIDEMGRPHNAFTGTDYGPADSLTSVTVDLAGATDVFISFYYQSGGLGNTPENLDSLVLEFYNGTTENWDWQWGVPGNNFPDFVQVILPVANEAYLQSDFRFRFRNYATIDGSFDHWNLDYVYLDANRSISDTSLVDVCFAQPINTLLKNEYVAMPWTHYQVDPVSNMVNTQDVIIRNLKTSPALIDETGVIVEYEGTEQINFTDPENPSVMSESDISITQEILSAPNNFSYSPTVSDVSAEFDVSFSLNSSPDENSENDQMSFTQTFLNYYDYSDGSAESNFGISDFTGSGSVAFRVNANIIDDLVAIQISFFPAGINSENVNILMTVWEDDGFEGTPGSIVYQSTEIEHPNFANTVNGYKTYFLEDTITVDHSYYIGWKQTTPEKATVGLDKNRNSAEERLYYNLSGSWIPGGLGGTALMRPQYVSDIEYVGIEEFEFNDALNLWPNPASDVISIQSESNINYDSAILYDQLGQQVAIIPVIQNTVNVQGLAEGLYFITFVAENRTLKTTKKIVVTH